MIRSHRLSLGFALLIASSAGLFAQTSTPTDAAVKEAVQRQANTIILQQKLAAAQDAQRRGELPIAIKLYEDSQKLVESIGPGNLGSETTAVIAGLTDVGLALAKDAQRRHDWNEADVRVSRVLKVNPRSAEAIEFKRANDKILAEMRGLTPSKDMVDKVPAWNKEKVENSTKIQDAKLLFENGKYDQAEALLKQVLEAEPGNYAAAYYSSLIKEQRDSNATLTRAIQSKQRILEVEGAWAVPTGRDRLPVPNPMAQTNLVYTSPDRQTILMKLDKIRLDTVLYDGLPLGEVLRSLSEECKKRDYDKQGINFILAPNADTASTPPVLGGPAQIDPLTGLPSAAPAAAAEPVDMSSISVKMFAPLSNIRLQHLLDIIVKSADRPIKYSIEDYGIVFTLKAPEATPLYSRTFKIDPNTFWMGLENVEGVSFGDVQTSSGGGGGGGGRGGGGGGQGGQGGDVGAIVPRVSVAGGSSSGGGGGRGGGGGGGRGGGGNTAGGLFSGAAATGAGGAGGFTGGGGGQTGQGGALPFITQQQSVAVVQQLVRSFFISVGVDLSQAGKSVFFNDRQGTLIVRATLQDLDIIEQAIQVLNIIPPQVNIKAKFAEVGQNDKRAIGFDWYLGNFLMGGNKLGAQGGTAPSYSGAPTTANPNGFFPGTSTANTIPSSASDQLITSGLRNTANAPAIGTLTGILTDPQFRVVLRMLEQREGVELLSAPDVTTVSGRQAQLQVVDIRTIVTGNDSSGGTQGAQNNFGTQTQAGTGPSINYNTQPLPFGPVLDVIPYVSADGFTVQMVIIPTITEFIGYDDPGQFIPQAQAVSSGAGGIGIPLTAQLPLPHFRVRQVTTTSIIWDGQTIVLGGLLSENVSKVKDKVPVLGDMPLVGRLFRSESNITEKKNLVIFVTPTIIDPAGNRVHMDEDLPFAQKTIPPQRPVVQTGAGAAK